MYNILINKINMKIAESLPYKGLVVDLGCGTGQYKDIILKSAKSYIGVDWENCSHDKNKIDVFADLNEKLPFNDEFADTIVSFQVMEHLPDPNHFLSECNRILKKGGAIFITVPFMWHIHEQPNDYYRFTRYGLSYLFKKNGFVNITINENSGFWQMWILKFNYHTNRYAKGILKYLLFPIWFLGQKIAPYLDKVDKNTSECTSYTIMAKKK